jgi:hypothetical protein
MNTSQQTQPQKQAPMLLGMQINTAIAYWQSYFDEVKQHHFRLSTTTSNIVIRIAPQPSNASANNLNTKYSLKYLRCAK